MRYLLQGIALKFIDLILTAFSLYAALCLRFGSFSLPSGVTTGYVNTLPWLLLFRTLSLHIFGVNRISTRHTGLRDVQVIGASTLAGSVAFAVYMLTAGPADFPKSSIIIEWLVNFMLVAGIRIMYRIIVDERPSGFLNGNHAARRILIIGAGARGASLAREIRRRSGENLMLVGLLDDDPSKQKLTIHGVPVLGKSQDVRAIVEARGIEEIILAMPSASGKEIRTVIAHCENLPVKLRISPGFSELNGGDQLRTIRDISIEDLLRRPPVRINMQEVARYLSGERVLVTGAGGSIGSELVRQIAAVDPAAIILVGHGENSIFEIEQELIRKGKIRPHCAIADVRDYDRLKAVFDLHRPTVVFHAAAHKHVPLMEANIVEAVTNNVMGTLNVCRISKLFGIRRMVMISTDKAVNPTSVMGASKRAAEIAVRLEDLDSSTEFAIVRFGNVLGSRGSVVPLMLNQIEQGGPVTVTHEDVTRYFMTIPEAVQLVIQAGALSSGGGTYLLDMGEPVKILDLARDLIRLSGLVPGKDINIEITGLRPGEKLYEELLTEEEGAFVTKHERIFATPAMPIEPTLLKEKIEQLILAAISGKPEDCISLLRELEPTYKKANELATVKGYAAVRTDAPKVVKGATN